ncbi:MAG: hypothetical protein ACYDAD_14205 [Acidimicrobiales bacterium]
MSARLLSPDTACFEMSVRGAITGAETVYRQHKGVFEVEHPDHVKALKAMGATDAAVRVAGRGFRCTDCGFAAVFRRCGRCGGACEREE